MAFLIADPDIIASAATDLATIGENVNAAHMVAAAPTAAVVPAAADEVSAAIASVFANHAQAFQGLAGKAAAFNDQFVQTLKSGGAAYAATEATSAALLRPLNASAASAGIQDDFVNWVNAAVGVLRLIIIAWAFILIVIGAIILIGLTAPILGPILDILVSLFPNL